MPEIAFADNRQKNFLDALIPLLQRAHEAYFAVAFAKYSGFRLLQPALENFLARGAAIEFLVGLDFYTTDAATLRALYLLRQTYKTCGLYCFSKPADDAASYHPKLYLFRSDDFHVQAAIGSSNFTQGGLQTNVEVNVILQFDPADTQYDALFDAYAALKYAPTCFLPDLAYIEAYESIQKQISQRSRRMQTHLRTQVESLEQKARSLPKPYTAPESLSGWQKLIFGKLPHTSFYTSDLYGYEAEFQAQYPENQNIRPKIRQVLQQLRDLGLLQHLGESRWQRAPLSQP
ncbi:MAG: hypothetical protein OHK0052_15620 [Anaerolineales bacterium]